MSEPGYREVPAFDPPEYEPDDDTAPSYADLIEAHERGEPLTPEQCDWLAERGWESRYQPADADPDPEGYGHA